MATHDYNIANDTGANVRSDINDALSAIVSNNSSASEPSTTFAYQWWADTTNDLLKQRNAADDGWLNVLKLSTGNPDGYVIGTDVQGYDADTAKTDTAQSFTEDQTFEAITETQTTKSASFTPDLDNDGTIYSCTSNMTITMPSAEAGKSFTIIHATATSITWAGTIKWNGGSEPTKGAGIDIYVFVSDGTNWYGNQAGTGYA